MLTLQQTSPDDPLAQPLLAALSAELQRITGNDGTASFDSQDTEGERAVFLMALTDGEPVGCGGLRPVTETICEIKRMYAKYPGQGIGATILKALERYAAEFGYTTIWLETRKINETAVQFYLRQGYQIRANYGKYVNRNDAVCFEKTGIH